ncbi:MAG: DUF2384 domain-containing protein [Nitrospiraceae bacterium]|jgi:putative toxin-antitoxin system antitoxin component (TIGR02293 family)|nr:DUF2384 domain-containing protein [Nitrospiraceae bacterium]
MGKKKDGLIGIETAVGPVKHKTLADPARPLRLSKESAAKVFRSYGTPAEAVAATQGGDAAARWLHRPQVGLGNARPVDRMKTTDGSIDVEILFGRMEYGVLA